MCTNWSQINFDWKLEKVFEPLEKWGCGRLSEQNAAAKKPELLQGGAISFWKGGLGSIGMFLY